VRRPSWEYSDGLLAFGDPPSPAMRKNAGCGEVSREHMASGHPEAEASGLHGQGITV
jgi:hypothetical protein